MKKLLCLMLCLGMLLACSVTSYAASGAIPVYMDGQKIEFDVEPIIVNGRTMVPMRAIFEHFGMSVKYDSTTKSIYASDGETDIVMQIDRKTFTKNGEVITMDAAPFIKDGKRTLVPLRAIAEALDIQVAWDSANHAVQMASDGRVPAPAVPSTFHIHFIDVGQADAALIECDGHYMLIDGGNKADSSLIYSVLKEEKVHGLDLMIATHVHEDHVGGLPGALNYTTAEKILCPVTSYSSDAFNDFKRYADKNGGLTVPKAGDIYALGSASVKILSLNAAGSTNDSSIVAKVTYRNTSFLFAGDAESSAEQALLNSKYASELRSTVLKVAHHGSDNATSMAFLRAVSPEYAVISVGDGNSYGFPDQDVLNRLESEGITLCRTDIHGDVYCESDGNTVQFSVIRNVDADPFIAPVVYTETSVQPEENVTRSGAEDADCDYVLNMNSQVFHYPYCSSVDKMSDKNKYYYSGPRENVINAGFRPCQRCNP